MCSRPFYLSQEDRMPDPHGAYISRTIVMVVEDYNSKGLGLGLALWLTTSLSMRIKNSSFSKKCVLFVCFAS